MESTMGAKDRFWASQKDWSRRKHLVLSYYLKPAAPKLRHISPDGRVIILDGYAGRGIYDDQAAGSPIYTGNLTEECRQWTNPVNLLVRNVEADIANFRELEKQTQKWVNLDYVTNYNSTYQEALPVILKEAGKAPLFAFLDPFSPKQLSLNDLAPLLNRKAITELLIVFFTPAVYRQIRALLPTARTSQSLREKLEASLDAVFGSRIWSDLLSNPDVSQQNVINSFLTAIAQRTRIGTRSKVYLCTKAIQANIDRDLKYHIIFVTTHPDGVSLMNDAFVKETVDLRLRTEQENKQADTGQLDLFQEFQETIEDIRVSERKRMIETLILSIAGKNQSKQWKREDLIFETLVSQFGEYNETECRQAIQRLVDSDERPTIKPIQGGKQRAKGNWSINNDTILQYYR